ncbi:hypothetical protein HP499_14960 [Paenarthrobacter sp. CM16]|uniref:hypothetical protein n=1 Tax=Paenarthrobacter sp. CM16 TaxID=2738447 RepID=UPI0015546D08|nr:hypothetical protein [Paenarthrobacter sp. CM16]NQD89093.1 hypothetical protein [Paenarthrobacter sp. CM16]
MESTIGRRSLMAGGGLALVAGAAFAGTAPAAAATAVTKNAKRVYYASDFGILPRATMPIITVDLSETDRRRYSRGMQGKPNVQAVGAPLDTVAIDQSDEINAFLQQVATLGGGIAIFEGDVNQLVGYGVKKPIVMLSEVAIWGLGWNKTTFMLMDGANCSVFVNKPGSNYHDVRDLRINGNRWGQSFPEALNFSGLGVDLLSPRDPGNLANRHPANPDNWQYNSHGILMVPDYTAPNASPYGDTYSSFENIFIVNPYGSAAMTNKVGGEIRFRNVVSQNAGGNGFTVGYDTYLSEVTVANSEYHGFLQQNGSTRFTNTKAFWCGQVLDRWQIGGGGVKVRRASIGYKIIGGCCEFSSTEAQNCGGEGFWLEDAESVNGQIASVANNMIADIAKISNPDGWGPVPNNFANDAAWNGGAASAKPTPADHPAVRLVGKSKYNNLSVTSRTAGQQAGVGLGQQAYALSVDALSGTMDNNISVTHSDGYDGKRVQGILTPDTPHSAIPQNWILANGKPLGDAVRKAPLTINEIDAAGTYIMMGPSYTYNPFPGGIVRLTCVELDNVFAVEADRLDAAGAPFTNIKYNDGLGWRGWVQRSRA